jgi:hypothetical protein
MAIPVQEIINRMRQVGLDAEGSEYYLDSVDLIPAINAGVEWCISIINQALGQKKFSEESLRELIRTRVWQSSQFSRVHINPDEIGGEIWSILAVYVRPCVYISNSMTLTNLPPQYQAEIGSSIDRKTCNKPIVSVHYNTATQLKPHESTFRPELSHIDSDKAAKRLTIEEWAKNVDNPFSSGANLDCNEIEEYAYLNAVDYTNLTGPTNIGGYQLDPPREIEIRPGTAGQLISIWYLELPGKITDAADTVNFPATMKNIVTEKALQYLAYKIGDHTTVYTVSGADIQNIIGSIV